MNVLVTGSNGFIGRALCSELERSNHQVIRAVRTSITPWEVPVGELNEQTPWDDALSAGVDVVVHLAGRVPADGKATDGKSNLFYPTNTLGTANLALQCKLHGVKRFIFISTVKVLGESKDSSYRSDDLAAPVDNYSISKWDAEQALCQISKETGLEVVILRPSLVYGPSVKGNFLHLLQAVDQGLPLPFGAVRNLRSLVYLDNLVDLIKLCLVHPAAAGKTFLVSDGDDVSTPELIRRVAKALGRNPFMVSVPVSWMKWAGKLLGKKAAVDRLVGSLSVEIAPLQQTLGWHPPYSMQAGLAATAQWYRQAKASA